MYATEIRYSKSWGSTLILHGLTESLVHLRNPRHISTTTAAELWRAVDSNGKQVIVKIAHFDYEWTVKAEGQWLHRLRGRRNIVPVVRYAMDGSYLIEEFVSGQCLDNIRIGAGELRESLIAEILRQLLIGLSSVHDMGGVHSDLSPRNVILGEEGETTLIDFGLCVPIGQMTPSHRGTPRYSAPEQFVGEEFEPTKLADYYSLAALGERLFSEAPGDKNSHWTDPMTTVEEIATHQQSHPIEVPPNAPFWLRYLITGFGGVRPSDRKGDMTKLRGSLHDAGRAARDYMWTAMSLVHTVRSVAPMGDSAILEELGCVPATVVSPLTEPSCASAESCLELVGLA